MSDASFNGIGFDCLITPLGRSVKSALTEQHIPGGNVTYVDSAGPGARHLKMTLYFDVEANYEALEAQVGNVATLVYIDGTYPNVLLYSLDRQKRYQGGGQTTADAEFIVSN